MPFFAFAFGLCFNDVIGEELRITSVDKLIEFSSNVNKGTNYSGTTVFLDSDLDLSGKSFEPIGYYNSWNDYKDFCGVFDGQGHVISNLKMDSSSQYVGLFGYSEGLSIKNVILDSSCSIASSFNGSDSVLVGGLIGYCRSDDRPCIIENSVNMGSVTFSGNGNSLYLGGLAGDLRTYSYDSIIKNCANYGDVTQSGMSDDSRIGGIVGESEGDSSSEVYIYNSLNHGTITHKGTTEWILYLGGISGYTKYTTIENCVRGGKILTTTTTSNYNYIGSIVGYVYSDTFIYECYFTNDYNKYGDTDYPPSESNTLSYDSTSFQLSGTVSIGDYTGNSLISALNAYSGYYIFRDYSNWVLNKNKKAVSFSINGKSTFTLKSQIILLPSLVSGKLWFYGWYEDSAYSKVFTKSEITSDTKLYGKFEENTNSYTITFDTKGGSSVSPIKAKFNSVVTLPNDSIRDHCTIAWWENKYCDKIDFKFTVPAHDITLYAVWKCTRIATPDDLIDFSKVVNNGVDSFNGTTVFLDSDLDFTGKTFEPIGRSYYFCGAFDGQGHVISNLKMTSSLQDVGLFGYSEGLTIKNVILDSSCAITNTYSSDDAYVGGIIGYCVGDNGPCTIENSVNMGSVSFSGDTSSDLRLGGIAGDLYSYSYDSTVKNCANYGDITYSGTSDDLYIGGIVGNSYGYSYIYNSLNHGTITHSGTTSDDLYLGGIAGYTYRTTIENCVSAGKISSTPTAAPNYNCIGSIVGHVDSYTTINYCYYASDLSGYNKYGEETPSSESNTLSYDSTTFVLNGTVSVGSYTGNSLIEALNAGADYNILHVYSHWVLNKNKYSMVFTINSRSNPINMNSKIILLPNLASDGRIRFDGWYTDKLLSESFKASKITNTTELYGTFCDSPDYIVLLDVNEGDPLQFLPVAYTSLDVYVDLPTPTRAGYTFVGWFTEEVGGDKIEPGDKVKNLNDHVLYAHWTVGGASFSLPVEPFFSFLFL